LFSDIFLQFSSSGLETKFLQNLEPFLLSGAFRKQHPPIPEMLIKKLLNHYEEKGNFKVLERVIMQLDLSEYPTLRADLMVTCEVRCLISGLLYLMSSQQVEEVRTYTFNRVDIDTGMHADT
jgi:Golgi CORVET complex core vacuolar protein 8